MLFFLFLINFNIDRCLHQSVAFKIYIIIILITNSLFGYAHASTLSEISVTGNNTENTMTMDSTDSGLMPISICKDGVLLLEHNFYCQLHECNQRLMFKKCPDNEVSTAQLNFNTMHLNCQNPSGEASSTSNDSGLVPFENCTDPFWQSNNSILRCKFQNCWFYFTTCNENESLTKDILLNFHTKALVCQNNQSFTDHTKLPQSTSPTQMPTNSCLTLHHRKIVILFMLLMLYCIFYYL